MPPDLSSSCLSLYANHFFYAELILLFEDGDSTESFKTNNAGHYMASICRGQ
jgi:hypothetical protein